MNEILESNTGTVERYPVIEADASLGRLTEAGFGPIPSGAGAITSEGWEHGDFKIPPSSKVELIVGRDGTEIPQIVGAIEE